MDSKDTGKNLSERRATSSAILSQRKHRRNILFGLTLVTLFLVFGGTVFLGEKLMEHPVAFLFFWLLCFSLVGLVLMLAIYDIGRIRRDHRRRIEDLDKDFNSTLESAEHRPELDQKKASGDD